MQKHIIALVILIPFQVASTVAFAYFIPHLTNMWYFPKDSFSATIKAEYAMGGWIMIVEFVVIAVAVLGTLAFEIWFLTKEGKGSKELNAKLDSIKESIDKLASEIHSRITR